MPDQVLMLEQKISHALLAEKPDAAARSLTDFSDDKIIDFLDSVRPSLAARTLEKMDPDRAAELLTAMPGEKSSVIITQADFFKIVLIISRLTPGKRELILKNLDPRLAKEFQSQLNYGADSVAYAMDPRFIAFDKSVPVRDVIKKIKSIRKRQILDVIVTEDDGTLSGIAPLQKIILSDPSTTIGELASPGPSIQAFDSREDVAELLENTRVTTLPVVDVNQRVIGVMRYETLFNSVRDEAASDLMAMVGVSRDERALSPPIFSVSKRLPWLNINLLTAFLAASVVGLFENVIAQFTALAVLLPVVAGQSGNTGAQALAVTMRGLALREVRAAQWFRILRKEFVVGFLNGVSVALVTCAGVYFWSRSPGLCLIIGVSMVISMIIASVSGGAIPLILARMGQDPATSSSIILTTVTDVMGFFSFLGLATLLSGLL